jgi:hypothetical protein
MDFFFVEGIGNHRQPKERVLFPMLFLPSIFWDRRSSNKPRFLCSKHATVPHWILENQGGARPASFSGALEIEKRPGISGKRHSFFDGLTSRRAVSSARDRPREDPLIRRTGPRIRRPDGFGRRAASGGGGGRRAAGGGARWCVATAPRGRRESADACVGREEET